MSNQKTTAPAIWPKTLQKYVSLLIAIIRSGALEKGLPKPRIKRNKAAHVTREHYLDILLT